jgi:hypothetical protein
MIKMENKTKVMALSILLVVAVSVIFIVPAVFAEDQELSVPPYENEGELKLRLERHGISYQVQRRNAIARRFITSGSYYLLTGEISAVNRHILVITDEDNTINVLMPKTWVIDGNKLSTQDLLDGEPFRLGDTVYIETLMLELERETHVVTSYLAYSMTVGEEAATALLPFNIEAIAPVE